MLQASLDQLIKANRVDEETPVDSVNVIRWNACVCQDQTVDSVPRNGVLMLRLEDHPWDVQMLSILQRLVDPGLNNFGTHLHLPVLGLEAGLLWLYLRPVSLFENSGVGLRGL